jgi:hypothetical protein
MQYHVHITEHYNKGTTENVSFGTGNPANHHKGQSPGQHTAASMLAVHARRDLRMRLA